MPIEIRELLVKFSVTEGGGNQNTSNSTQSISEELKKDIIEQCSEIVLEKLSRFEER